MYLVFLLVCQVSYRRRHWSLLLCLCGGCTVPLVGLMYLVFLLACQVRVTVGDSGLCCCVCVEDVPYLWLGLCT